MNTPIRLTCPMARPKDAPPTREQLDGLTFPAILLEREHSGHFRARILDSESDLFYLADDRLEQVEANHGELYTIQDGVRLISSGELYRWIAHDLNSATIWSRSAYQAASADELVGQSSALFRAADELGWETIES